MGDIFFLNTAATNYSDDSQGNFSTFLCYCNNSLTVVKVYFL